MASITLSPVVGWLVGETISAYLANAGNQKVGSPVATAAVSADSTTTFTGLASDTRFIATDGTYEIRFSTPPAETSTGSGLPDGGSAGEVLTKASSDDGDAVWSPAGSVNTILYDSDLGAWPARPTDEQTVAYMWLGPTFPDVGGAGEFVSEVDVYIPDAEVPGGGDLPAEVKGVIVWDGTGDLPARPTGYASVEWISPTDPAANALDGDTWIPTA